MNCKASLFLSLCSDFLLFLSSFAEELICTRGRHFVQVHLITEFIASTPRNTIFLWIQLPESENFIPRVWISISYSLQLESKCQTKSTSLIDDTFFLSRALWCSCCSYQSHQCSLRPACNVRFIFFTPESIIEACCSAFLTCYKTQPSTNNLDKLNQRIFAISAVCYSSQFFFSDYDWFRNVRFLARNH